MARCTEDLTFDFAPADILFATWSVYCEKVSFEVLSFSLSFFFWGGERRKGGGGKGIHKERKKERKKGEEGEDEREVRRWEGRRGERVEERTNSFLNIFKLFSFLVFCFSLFLFDKISKKIESR